MAGQDSQQHEAHHSPTEWLILIMWGVGFVLQQTAFSHVAWSLAAAYTAYRLRDDGYKVLYKASSKVLSYWYLGWIVAALLGVLWGGVLWYLDIESDILVFSLSFVAAQFFLLVPSHYFPKLLVLIGLIHIGGLVYWGHPAWSLASNPIQYLLLGAPLAVFPFLSFFLVGAYTRSANLSWRRRWIYLGLGLMLLPLSEWVICFFVTRDVVLNPMEIQYYLSYDFETMSSVSVLSLALIYMFWEPIWLSASYGMPELMYWFLTYTSLLALGETSFVQELPGYTRIAYIVLVTLFLLGGRRRWKRGPMEALVYYLAKRWNYKKVKASGR